MTARYSVLVADQAGEFCRREVLNFAAALALFREFRLRYPRKVVAVANLDQCDVDSDGLTDDEREAVGA